MTAAVRAELRKILTTRLWWALLAAMGGAVAFLAGALALAIGLGGQQPGDELTVPPDQLALTVYSAGVTLGYVFPLAFGAIIVTQEFRHRTFQTSVLAEPRRTRVAAAKLLAALPFALAYGLASSLAALAAGAPALALAGTGTMLDDPATWRTLALGAVAMAAWMLVGVGFGTLVTNQVAVVVGVLVWTQIVEPLARIGLGYWDAAAPVARFLPGAAGEAIAGSSFYSATGLSDLLAPWAGLLVLLGYGLVAAAIGWRTSFRRDIT
ncbi:ABC transporter permease [Demequina sp. SYSU T00039]|uniref:ABC transporter permease n=1 Tax=Demequina lignilytica TaxID=3051663 RepID=A0AAW7M527_9MICO|nr:MULTISPECIES: ABC transporter permease [unclassified Demequina]MDN4478302.1 ABC transporter permease [Demequina sp. SYSU T00039-1]MDN4489102.1 ABC transporter permease [Demequina sp. SYSU T00039]